MVLVGGKGTRLRPLTLSAPKPMLPTAGLPFLTHLLSRIAAAGIEHVILGTSYKPAVFEAEFGDGSALGLQIEYVTEEHPLGLAAASPTLPASCATTPRWCLTAMCSRARIWPNCWTSTEAIEPMSRCNWCGWATRGHSAAYPPTRRTA